MLKVLLFSSLMWATVGSAASADPTDISVEACIQSAVELEQLERLGVLAGGDLDLVSVAPEQPDQRPEHEHVRRSRHVHPHAHLIAPRAALLQPAPHAAREAAARRGARARA